MNIINNQISHTLNFLKSKSKYLIFTAAKYLEYGITAFVFFSLARLVSATQYGEAAPGFIAISYSSLIILGVNQVLIKWYALSSDTSEKIFLIKYNIFYNLLFSFLVVFVIYIVLPLNFSLIVGLIAGIKLFQESLINISRAKQELTRINAIYLTFAFTFLAIYSFFVENIEQFFTAWLLSLSVSVTLAIILVRKDIFGQFSINKFIDWLKLNYLKLLLDGLKLAVIGAIVPLYLSIDRILLIKFEVVSEALIGNLQLADNIATIISFGISSVLFITNPIFIEKIKNKSLLPKYLIQKGYTILIGLLLILLIGLYPLVSVVNFFFREYEYISLPLSFYLISRLFFIGLFIPNIIMITYSKEVTYLKIVYFGFFFLITAYGISIYTISESVSIIFILPIILCLTIILIHLLMRRALKKMHFH